MEKDQPNIEKQDVKPSGYKVESVLLLTSNFWRDINFDIQSYTGVNSKIDVKPEGHETTPEGKFAVTLTLKYEATYNSEDICKAEITMIGVFEKFGEPPLPDDKFKAINAPAIIYPFIREH